MQFPTTNPCTDVLLCLSSLCAVSLSLVLDLWALYISAVLLYYFYVPTKLPPVLAHNSSPRTEHLKRLISSLSCFYGNL
ncbi:hypothetical protein GDO78_005862 [Eleutherodactylus coqui]|uniref:Uncharacterized protein n=1 Tax=Eleutherodactylus coqui TaxID=57060 RepID=A0A8J6KDQ5_ELECQ|nr:hypothetical protein GDO78_005862 [Eleutherodactylus coqui]